MSATEAGAVQADSRVAMVKFLADRLKEDEAAVTVGLAVRALGANHAARLLREIETKRAIIEAHNVAEHYCPIPVLRGRHGQLWTPAEGPCWTLRVVAGVYRDHWRWQLGWLPNLAGEGFRDE